MKNLVAPVPTRHNDQGMPGRTDPTLTTYTIAVATVVLSFLPAELFALASGAVLMVF